MATIPAVSLKHHFADLIDPRGERSRLHELLDVVGIALCAVIAGAESWPAVEGYGHAKHDWLARHFRLPNGIPSHDTFRRVFCLLDPEAFQQSFADWVAAMADRGAGTLRVIVSPVQKFLQLPKETGAGHPGDRSREGRGTG